MNIRLPDGRRISDVARFLDQTTRVAGILVSALTVLYSAIAFSFPPLLRAVAWTVDNALITVPVLWFALCSYVVLARNFQFLAPVEDDVELPASPWGWVRRFLRRRRTLVAWFIFTGGLVVMALWVRRYALLHFIHDPSGYEPVAYVLQLNYPAVILIPTLCLLIVAALAIEGALSWESLKSLNAVAVVSPAMCFSGPYVWKNTLLDKYLTAKLPLYTAALFLAGTLLVIYLVLLASFGHLATRRIEQRRTTPSFYVLGHAATSTPCSAAAEPFRVLLWLCVLLLYSGLSIFGIVVVDICWEVVHAVLPASQGLTLQSEPRP